MKIIVLESRYSCEKLGRSRLWYPSGEDEAKAFYTYFWANSWSKKHCTHFWSPVQLFEDQFVDVYSNSPLDYMRWYPGKVIPS